MTRIRVTNISRISTKSKSSLSLVINLPASALKTTQTPFGIVLDLENGQILSEPGAPAFPSQRVKIALPANSIVKDLKTKVVKKVAVTKEPQLVAPAQEPRRTAGSRKQAIKRSLFGSDVLPKEPRTELHPAQGITLPRFEMYRQVFASPPPLVRILDTGYRGVATVVELELHPVSQNEKGILELATQIQLTVAYEPIADGATAGAYFREPRNLAEAQRFTNIMKAEVLNPAWVKDFGPFWPIFDYDYLVITDNQAWDAATSTPVAGSAATVGDMVSAFERIAAWKKRRGLRTRIVKVADIVNGSFGDFKTGTRDLQEVIRNFLKWAYNAWGIAWVLLGGDSNIIPVRSVAGDGCGGIGIGTDNPPGDNKSFWTGTFLKMHVIGDPHSWWPGNPSAETLVNPASGTVIPFDSTGTSDAAHPGWYFTTNDTYATRSVAATKYLRVNGPAALLNTNLRWLYTWNIIPTDLYYSSLVSPSYGVPGLHDWDHTDNGIYGQHSGGSDLDGVKLGADIGIGRAPVGTAAEADAFVTKVLAYEMLKRQDGTALDLNWARRLTVVSTNFGGRLTISKTAANPPGDNQYRHGAGDLYSLIHLKDLFSDLNWRLFVKVTDTDVRIMPYDPEAPVSGRGWYFAVSNADLTPSEQIFVIWGTVYRIPVPTNWVVVYGEADEREPMNYIFDKTTADTSMTDQEALRKQISTDFPGINAIKRLYEDEVDLPAADAASPPISHVTSDRVRDALNLGPHLLCLSGHGSSGGCCHLGAAMATAATNGFHQPIAYAASCLTGDFTANDATSEKLLQNTAGGAVAYIGYTRFGWIGVGDDFARKFFERMKTTRHLALLNDSRFDLTNKWTILAQNLLGDPETPVWVGKPKTMSVTHPAVIYKQSQEITVKVKGVSNAPLSGAVICLSIGATWMKTRYTNALGEANFEITPPATGTMDITVTAQDYAPNFGTITVKEKVVCSPMVSCGTSVACLPSIVCPPKVVCSAAIACKASILCKEILTCKASLVACGISIECPASLSACKAGIGHGCPAIDPVDFWDFDDIIRQSGVRDLRELAAKVDTRQVKAVLDKLSPTNRKAVVLMLKRIAKR
ncbi:MAG: hypothetical protein KJ900_01265 [Proteobacteria bacterium]|nr:hypothetical protein [Desulfocapsa sp.]MBU3943991.1 hypothetical protein [Pseudomonadota bacterium]MCG2743841.1 C25 family cysteine peptidase [Desulfobacteraceae bacterium]MBU3984240.1 hypothetical protein [Pseudomonadota bacterium]MBU4029564.1 hypothetical protein [Pseudomonadota bacterium]